MRDELAEIRGLKKLSYWKRGVKRDIQYTGRDKRCDYEEGRMDERRMKRESYWMRGI